MPDSQPALINVKNPEYQELIRQLNFIFKDIYRWVDYMRGIRNNTFEPENTNLVGEHDHTSSDEGGDYPWADFTAADVVYLQALRAAILIANLLDKSANEEISGIWTFDNEVIVGGSQYDDGKITDDGDFSIEPTSDTYIKGSAILRIGIFATTPRGQILLTGAGTGQTDGAVISLAPSADYDDPIAYYAFQVNEDDLLIGSDDDPDALKYDGANTRWDFSATVNLSALTASTLLALDASKNISSLTKQSHIENAETNHATSDFAGVNSALNALGTKINSILSALETAGILNTS